MPRPKMTAQERLEALKKKEQQLKAQRQAIEARLQGQARKDDTRRKIIAGALALEHAASNQEFGDALNRLIFRYVKKPEDRALFGLDSLESSPLADAKRTLEAAEAAGGEGNVT